MPPAHVRGNPNPRTLSRAGYLKGYSRPHPRWCCADGSPNERQPLLGTKKELQSTTPAALGQLAFIHMQPNASRLADGNPKAKEDSSFFYDQAAAIVDEWHPEWDPDASSLVDRHIGTADLLQQEERF